MKEEIDDARGHLLAVEETAIELLELRSDATKGHDRCEERIEQGAAAWRGADGSNNSMSGPERA
jgi:hypothetical protein